MKKYLACSLLILFLGATLSASATISQSCFTEQASSESVIEPTQAEVEPVTTILAVAKAIKAGVGLGEFALKVYKEAPEAEYYLMFHAEDGKTGYVKASSAAELVNMAVVALTNTEAPAEWVVLSSKYPSVKGFCLDWGKRYYKENVDDLLKCL